MKIVRAAALLLPALLGLTLLWSCRGREDRALEAGPTTAELEKHIRNLSSDELEGRGMGSRGIELAARYQEDYFKTFGLEPAFGTSYRQTFKITGARPDPGASLEIFSPTIRLLPVLHDEFIVNSEREDASPEVTGELVYCGYFIQAPERQWDDIKGADLKGKVLLVEINEPGNTAGGIFDGEDMTYYGRWMYKFEEAAALGAAGIFIIHDEKGAAYNWDVLRNSSDNEGFFLADKKPQLFFQGWIAGAAADKIFEAVKLDHKALRARAETPEFAPVPLGLAAKVRELPTFRSVDAVNVAGIVRARHPKARKRMIVVSAHYDHFGRDPKLEGDQIFNGAVDNCAATAAMLALAGSCAERPDLLMDDLCFVGVTAEEKGLLGSDYFARHLPFQAATVEADINFEMTNVWGETEDVFAIGARHSDLDDVCRKAAWRAGLRYIPERNGEFGFFFRSDQLSFARAGIPGVWLHQGITSRGPDKDAVQKKFEDYRQTKYHKVGDEMQPDWDLRGTLQIIAWARAIIDVLGERALLPQWRPESSFRR